MNCPAYTVIEKPRPPPGGNYPVSTPYRPAYDQACVEFLYACFCELPVSEIRARAERMREAKILELR